jgi:exosome complex exonuclease RRP6
MLTLYSYLMGDFFGDRYAREDTHYLLHIYDLMRALLLSKPIDNENADPPLLEVWF